MENRAISKSTVEIVKRGCGFNFLKGTVISQYLNSLFLEDNHLLIVDSRDRDEPTLTVAIAACSGF